MVGQCVGLEQHTREGIVWFHNALWDMPLAGLFQCQRVSHGEVIAMLTCGHGLSGPLNSKPSQVKGPDFIRAAAAT